MRAFQVSVAICFYAVVPSVMAQSVCDKTVFDSPSADQTQSTFDVTEFFYQVRGGAQATLGDERFVAEAKTHLLQASRAFEDVKRELGPHSWFGAAFSDDRDYARYARASEEVARWTKVVEQNERSSMRALASREQTLKTMLAQATRQVLGDALGPKKPAWYSSFTLKDIQPVYPSSLYEVLHSPTLELIVTLAANPQSLPQGALRVWLQFDFPRESISGSGILFDETKGPYAYDEFRAGHVIDPQTHLPVLASSVEQTLKDLNINFPRSHLNQLLDQTATGPEGRLALHRMLYGASEMARKNEFSREARRAFLAILDYWRQTSITHSSQFLPSSVGLMVISSQNPKLQNEFADLLRQELAQSQEDMRNAHLASIQKYFTTHYDFWRRSDGALFLSPAQRTRHQGDESLEWWPVRGDERDFLTDADGAMVRGFLYQMTGLSIFEDPGYRAYRKSL